jgi:uncharacterized protein YndB with AHSA1/START domain
MVNTFAMPESVAVSRHINASPEAMWALVTDLPRMGEWSPENNGGVWLNGATTAAVGVKFKGANANGKKSWSTVATVTELAGPRAFAFTVKAAGLKIADWRYDLVAVDGGVTVTETWTDIRGWLAKKAGSIASNVTDRAAHNCDGMERTLAALAATAEAP